MNKPFLKWVGGKHRIIDKVVHRLPKGNRLVEPFVGSGAVFMGTDYDAYLLADGNGDLINLFTELRDGGDEFVEYVRGFFVGENNTPSRYYDLRDSFNATGMRFFPALRAALFVYLNRHGYNGLCRYNLSSEFNVPYGKYKNVHFPEQEMRAFANKLRERDVTLVHADFKSTLGMVQRGDVVYCDPPYVPLSDTMNFTQYTPGGFGWREQVELAGTVIGLYVTGIPAVISNHSHKALNRLYRNGGGSMSFIDAPRSVSCNGASRKPAREVLALFNAA